MSDKYLKYLSEMPNYIKNKYKFSNTPVLLKQRIFEELKEITNKTLDFLSSDFHYKNIQNKSSFFEDIPLKNEDYLGSVDFHINQQGIKIIEVNMFPPGLASLVDFMESSFQKHLMNSKVSKTSKNYIHKYLSNLTNNFELKNIAICDFDLDNEYNIGEFQYIKELLEKEDIKVSILEARELKKDHKFDRIFNRTIPSLWEKNKEELKIYTEIYNKDPSSFFPNPNVWKYASKDMFSEMEKYFEEDDDIQNKILQSKKLSKFESIEELKSEFGSPSKTILKPLSEFAGKGIFLKPSNKILERIFEEEKENYIIQRLFKAGKINYEINNSQTKELKYDLRMVFINKEICGSYARVYEGGITNFRGEYGGLAPVFVE